MPQILCGREVSESYNLLFRAFICDEKTTSENLILSKHLDPLPDFILLNR